MRPGENAGAERVAIITGAGRGLGRSYALALAERGVRVVVNDLGSTVDGTEDQEDAAGKVVAEILAAGGEAIANYASVTDPVGVQAMVEETIEHFGRIDILINNAGILRDRSFHKVALDDLLTVLDVHLTGSIRCTHAVWPHMREQGYGRILFTSSQNGTYGNFGQAGYATAKAGVLGLMKVLAIEGESKNIRTNTIVPVARSRMTLGTIIGEESDADRLPPEAVASGVLFLVGEDAPNGTILNAGGGCFSVSEIPESRGVFLGVDAQPEDVRARWNDIGAGGYVDVLPDGPAQFTKFLGMQVD
ncbi:SDR family NAD(P)-dependent oxidoreductase [Nocardioides sp. dk4132]|uniref:SDR family NAD(P)-dependent oxidoreductase n=1 Tax=unclassified Nocardioides TaxID=2615069 RepID=UPI00129672D3|nr:MULTISPECIES: SDR family NAD(P)-dependent oxidoreductase [unclassified Nocardioides]MQW77622.1 SDR family NAD(P)-dependent oxidoreductase [Nocardioides sp. dk4132]QGA06148.1 SDR family NAD(P)-dependent oxidoreductase [Nocardioides sp. dk884]